MKKIVFYIKGIYNGGTEIALLNLITVLDKSLYDIYIINEDFENYNKLIFDKMNKYAKIIKLQEIEADVLVFCTSNKTEMNIIKEKIKYKKSYFWFHYFSKNQLDFLEYVNKNKYVDRVIVVCETIKNKLLKLEMYKNFKDNIISIYNILLDDIYIKAQENVEIELSNNINFITVARLCKEKGFYRMKYLIDYLIEKNIDFKWHILGTATNEKDFEEINNIINCYASKVVMYGFQENPYKYISKCDYLVLLSDEENMPYTVIEAKALGIPCILTNFDSAFEQIEDMKNGIILDKENIETYKDRIEDILNNKELFKIEIMKYKYSNNESIKKWNSILN